MFTLSLREDLGDEDRESGKQRSRERIAIGQDLGPSRRDYCQQTFFLIEVPQFENACFKVELPFDFQLWWGIAG